MGQDLETSLRNLPRAIEIGEDVGVLLPRLDAVDAELQGKRYQIVPQQIELPGDPPELYQEMVGDLATSFLEESVAGCAADGLHWIVDRIVVHWVAEADDH